MNTDQIIDDALICYDKKIDDLTRALKHEDTLIRKVLIQREIAAMELLRSNLRNDRYSLMKVNICEKCTLARYKNHLLFIYYLRCGNCGEHAACSTVELSDLNELDVKILADTDAIYVGKYKNTPLANVPASYLLWLYKQAWFKQSSNAHYRSLVKYIATNLEVLRSQDIK